jgi:fructose-specific phosphotransferase system component IIB
LLEGLGHDEKGLNGVLEALKEEDLEKLNQVLLGAERRVKGAKKKRIEANLAP